MSRYFLFFFIFFVTSLTLIGANEVVNNRETPKGKFKSQEKRSAVLTEVLRLTDEGGGFVLKNPRRIKVAPDGSIFVDDRSNLLQFDREGHFQKNFLKRGEGPGEVKYFANFFFAKNSVVIGAFMPVKLIFTSFEGKFLNEFRVHKVKPFTLLMHCGGDKFYFRANDISPGIIKNGINQRIHRIIYCNDQGKVFDTDLSFATKDAVIKQTSKEGRVYISMDEMTDFITVFDNDRYLYVVHTDRYMVNQVDLNTGKVVRRFNRNFQPVGFKIREGLEKDDARLQEIKNQKFYNDIYALLVYEGKLLVFTSIMDDKNQVLVDVFDNLGQYINNFYLKIPLVKRPDDLRRKPMCFNNGFFWTSSIDEEDNPYVIKYEVDIFQTH